MKLIKQSRAGLLVEDYGLALREAVQYLGEQYAVAVPVKSQPTYASVHGFFREERSWNQVVRKRRPVTSWH
jgi:hypothetical protein